MSKSYKANRPGPNSSAMENALNGMSGAEVIYSLSEAELLARDVDMKLMLFRYVITATLN